MKRFLIVRTTADEDFKVTGEIYGITETDAFERARAAGLAPRHSNHLMLLDETGFPFEKRTYKIDDKGFIVWLISKDYDAVKQRVGTAGRLRQPTESV